MAAYRILRSARASPAAAPFPASDNGHHQSVQQRGWIVGGSEALVVNILHYGGSAFPIAEFSVATVRDAQQTSATGNAGVATVYLADGSMLDLQYGPGVAVGLERRPS
jgi:ferric-dicitrate binding protein FerR (iron transport regulator)